VLPIHFPPLSESHPAALPDTIPPFGGLQTADTLDSFNSELGQRYASDTVIPNEVGKVNSQATDAKQQSSKRAHVSVQVVKVGPERSVWPVGTRETVGAGVRRDAASVLRFTSALVRRDADRFLLAGLTVRLSFEEFHAYFEIAGARLATERVRTFRRAL